MNDFLLKLEDIEKKLILVLKEREKLIEENKKLKDDFLKLKKAGKSSVDKEKIFDCIKNIDSVIEYLKYEDEGDLNQAKDSGQGLSNES